MDHASVFLEAIREAPDDDTPRLIYADWLDDHGGSTECARAAFIRAQVRIETLDRGDPARLDLEEQARDLLAEHEQEWTEDLPAEVDAWEFRRGFLEQVSLTGAAFLEFAPQLMAAGPLRAVHLTLSEEHVAGLAACPDLARVEALDFGPSGPSTYRLTDRSLQTLLESPHLGRLKSLGLRCQAIGPLGVQTLVQSPWMANLRHLDLRENYTLGDLGARHLAGAAQATRLEELLLRNCHLTRVGIWALFSSRCLPALHALDVEAGRLFDAPGTTALTQRLLKQPLAARLTSLDLEYASRVGELLPLLTSEGLPRLKSLSLCTGGIGDSGAAVLATSPHLSKLTALTLEHCRLGPAGLQVLAGSPHLAGLTTLRLGHNAVRDTGVKALASSPHLRRLVHLDLSHNAIGGPGLRALAASANLAHLQELDLSANYVGQASVEALASSPYLRNLTALGLGYVSLDADGARALAASPNFRWLTRLDLTENQIDDRGTAALAASPYLRHLVELRLWHNRIGQAGAEALAASPHLRRLKRLDLQRNDFTDTEWRLLEDRFGKSLQS